MSSVDPFYSRQFRRMDEDLAQQYRDHEGDDHPAANEPLTTTEAVKFWAWALGVPAAVVCVAVIAAYWPH